MHHDNIRSLPQGGQPVTVCYGALDLGPRISARPVAGCATLGQASADTLPYWQDAADNEDSVRGRGWWILPAMGFGCAIWVYSIWKIVGLF